MNPLRTGSAFALTVMIFYSLCTLVAMAYPEPFMGFMNALFHGMDFRLLRTGQGFTWSGFLYVLLVMGLWSFGAGACFAWLQHVIAGTPRNG